MINLFKKSIYTFILGVCMIMAVFGTVSASAQIALPNVCPAGGCPVIGNKTFSNYRKEEVAALIISVANLLTYFVGALAVLMIVFGGILMIVGRGDAGWMMIKNAIIGLVVAVLAYSVVYIVSQIANTNLFGSN